MNPYTFGSFFPALAARIRVKFESVSFHRWCKRIFPQWSLFLQIYPNCPAIAIVPPWHGPTPGGNTGKSDTRELSHRAWGNYDSW